MASGDYRSCDVCGCKCFYDASLNYDYLDETWDDVNKVVVMPDDGVLFNGKPTSVKLEYLGSWAVVCNTCSKEYVAIVTRKEATK